MAHGTESVSTRARRIALVIVALGLTSITLACQGQAPVTLEPTPTDEIVYEVVTNTPQPTLAETEVSEPTITPVATYTPIPGLGPVPKKTATRTPTKFASPVRRTRITPSPTATIPATATPEPPTAVPLKYNAPVALAPQQPDSHHTGDDVTLTYQPSAYLNPNECYLLHFGMINPNAGPGEAAGDDFLDTAHCGDQTPPGGRLNLTVYRPGWNGYNYGLVLDQAKQAAPTTLLYVRWYIYIVRNNGSIGDGVHYNTVPLSPTSAILQFDFLP